MIARSAGRHAGSLEEESHTAENGVSLCPQRIIVPDPLVGCFEHDVRRWKKSEPKILKAHLPGTGRQAELCAGNPGELAVCDALQILVGVTVEWNELPFTIENRSQRNVKCDLSGVAVH